METSQQLATLGGGCFWCLEPIFTDLLGVDKVTAGYSGGQVANPSYRSVCTGATGHAEVVQVQFDSAVIPYADLLELFFAIHDPTTLNRQGADAGTQYRSVIFYHDRQQRKIAAEVIARLGASGVWDDPIVTELAAYSEFYRAEEEHQKYFALNGEQPYCRVVIAPKVAKFRRDHIQRLRG